MPAILALSPRSHKGEGAVDPVRGFCYGREHRKVYSFQGIKRTLPEKHLRVGETVKHSMGYPGEDIEREFQQLRARLSEMMETLLHRGRPALVRGSTFKPAIDVYESSSALIIVMEIAGAKREDVEVTLDGNRLRIAGVRRVAAPLDAQRCHQMEIEFGQFERWVNLDFTPPRDAVEATYRDGFLHITIPRQAVPTATTVRILGE